MFKHLASNPDNSNGRLYHELDDDLIFNYKNADVLIDKTSIELIKGSKIDYVNELIGSSFKISNPLASSSCGCGTSFSI